MNARRGGSALIVVLLLLTLLIVLTAQITTRTETDARALENGVTELQAQYALQGALVHAMAILAADATADQAALDAPPNLPKADWLGEAWTHPAEDLPLGDGTYGFSITDEQGRYNINALVDGTGALIPDEQPRLQRLLARACPALDTTAFRDALGDWEDKAASGQPEIGIYETGAPNRPLLTTKELRLLPTATTEILAGLLPRIGTGLAPQVNVNTAQEDVLYALSEAFGAVTWAKLQARLQAQDPLRDLADLKALSGIADAEWNALLPRLSVRSSIFRVSLRFAKGGTVRRATALVLRVDGQPPKRLRWDPDPLSP